MEHRSPPMDLIPSQTHSVHNLTHCFIEIFFKSIHPSMSRSPKYSHQFRIYIQLCNLLISRPPSAIYMRPLHSCLLDRPNNIWWRGQITEFRITQLPQFSIPYTLLSNLLSSTLNGNNLKYWTFRYIQKVLRIVRCTAIAIRTCLRSRKLFSVMMFFKWTVNGKITYVCTNVEQTFPFLLYFMWHACTLAYIYAIQCIGRKVKLNDYKILSCVKFLSQKLLLIS
jgi:hypothetical protein